MEKHSWESRICNVGKDIYVYIARPGIALSNAGAVVGTKYGMFVDALGNAKATHNFQTEISNRTEKEIPIAIMTHSHGDHTFGMHGYANVLKVMTRKAKTEADKDPDSPTPFIISKSLIFTAEGSKRSPPDIVFEDNLTFDLGGTTVEIKDYGHCHTTSDTVVHIPERSVIFCGDILFNKIGFMGAYPNFTNWIAALDALIAINAEHYIPGHGPIATRQDVTEAREYLNFLYQTAKNGKDRGINPIDLAEDTDIGKYEKWQEPERIVLMFEVMYRELDGLPMFPPKPPAFNVQEERVRMAKEGRRVNKR